MSTAKQKSAHKHYLKNREKYIQYGRAVRKTQAYKDKYTTEYFRRLMWKKRYDLTEEAYSAILKSQKGGCAVCGSVDPKSSRKTCTVFDVDHDHKTGKVRGLLCHNCNVTVGYVEKPIVPKILEYLKKWEGK